MSEIKFVYFDVGDVLFNWRNVFSKLAVMFNKTPEEFWTIFIKYDNDVCRGKLTAQELWENLKKELEIKGEIKNFVEWWAESFSPIPTMHALVEDASKKYKIGIFTNIYPDAWGYYVANKLIPDVSYDSIVQSCDVGLVKPEAEIYKYAQDKSGVSAQEILFIDNSRENIDEADRLGWQTVWYDVKNPQKSVAEVKQILELN